MMIEAETKIAETISAIREEIEINIMVVEVVALEQSVETTITDLTIKEETIAKVEAITETTPIIVQMIADPLMMIIVEEVMTMATIKDLTMTSQQDSLTSFLEMKKANISILEFCYFDNFNRR